MRQLTHFSSAPCRGLDFHGSRLDTFEHQGERWVVLRPVVEGMGLSWGSQFTKLTKDRERFGCSDIETTGADGKRYVMTCIPLRSYPMWLATSNPAGSVQAAT